MSFPPCRLWRAGGVRPFCAAGPAPLSRSLDLRIQFSVREIAGVRAKSKRRWMRPRPRDLRAEFSAGASSKLRKDPVLRG